MATNKSQTFSIRLNAGTFEAINDMGRRLDAEHNFVRGGRAILIDIGADAVALLGLDNLRALIDYAELLGVAEGSVIADLVLKEIPAMVAALDKAESAEDGAVAEEETAGNK